MAVEILKRIHISDCDNNNTEHNELEEVVKDITSEIVLESQNAANSLQQQLKAAIFSITHVESIVITRLLKKDFVVLANTKTNNLNIRCTYYNKTSTATEGGLYHLQQQRGVCTIYSNRVFSIAGLTGTKIRTRLNFTTFNAIIFLIYAFLKMK